MNKEFLSLAKRVAETALDNAQQVLGDYKSKTSGWGRTGDALNDLCYPILSAYTKDVDEVVAFIEEIGKMDEYLSRRSVVNLQNQLTSQYEQAVNKELKE